MTLKTIAKKWCLCFLFIGIVGCPLEKNSDGNDEENQGNPATINFFNSSSFKVDIYKNLNPEFFDPTTLVCTVNPGQTKKVTVYASMDQKIGDTFYLRYKVLLADSLMTGTSDIYIDARRDLSNMAFVVEEGKTYTKTVPQPAPGQLKFMNGYIKIQNQGTTQIQIINGIKILSRLDNQAIYLIPGQLGFYEIAVPFFDDVLTVSQLKAFSGAETPIPSFTMERGKLYSFIVNGSTVTGPNVIDIVY
jgi:hypothetical protein